MASATHWGFFREQCVSTSSPKSSARGLTVLKARPCSPSMKHHQSVPAEGFIPCQALTGFHGRRHDVPNIVTGVRTKYLAQTLCPHKAMEGQAVIIRVGRFLAMSNQKDRRCSSGRDGRKKSEAYSRAQQHIGRETLSRCRVQESQGFH